MRRIAAVITRNGKVMVCMEELAKLKNNGVLIKVHASLISPGTEVVRNKK